MHKSPQTTLRDGWLPQDLPADADPFRLLVQSVREYAICLICPDGFIRSWNAGAEAITGYTEAEAIGRHCSLLYTPDEVTSGWPARELATVARHGHAEDEGWRIRKGGARFWANVVVTALHDPDGRLYGYAKIIRDLTEQKQQKDALERSEKRSERLWNEAIKDSLTGAYNRRYMLYRLRGDIDRSDPKAASLLLIDLDDLKPINDRYGHATGDQVLKLVAGVAHKTSREGDLLFRIGGDEFALYLPAVSAAGAAVIAERLRAAVASARTADGVAVTVSVGVAERCAGDTPEAWIQRADQAMYEAKRGGRDRVQCEGRASG